jgi:2-oxoisovalerate dehydrogenase E1 component alpha subunit
MIFFQALTYRVGHHSTSDDSTKYRPVEEIQHWRTARDPISRYRKWVQGNDWWSDAEESELRKRVRQEVTMYSICCTKIHISTVLYCDA